MPLIFQSSPIFIFSQCHGRAAAMHRAQENLHYGQVSHVHDEPSRGAVSCFPDAIGGADKDLWRGILAETSRAASEIIKGGE